MRRPGADRRRRPPMSTPLSNQGGSSSPIVFVFSYPSAPVPSPSGETRACDSSRTVPAGSRGAPRRMRLGWRRRRAGSSARRKHRNESSGSMSTVVGHGNLLPWPAGALSNDAGAILHGDSTCMQLTSRETSARVEPVQSLPSTRRTRARGTTGAARSDRRRATRHVVDLAERWV